MARVKRRRGSDAPRSIGQTLVEFAIILPIFLLLLLIAIDFGRLFFSYIAISNAAREGAAYGAANPTNTVGIRQHATQETSSQNQLGAGGITVASACANTVGATIACSAASGGAGIGNSIRVTVTEPFTFLTPIISDFFIGDVQMQASASAMVLGFAPSPNSTAPTGCSAPTLATFSVVVNGLDVEVNPAASQPDFGICAISGYNWEWGDGDSEAGAAIASSHTYASSGTYNIKLTITNQGGSLSKAQDVPVGSAVPTPTPTPAPTPTPTPGPTAVPTPTPTPSVCAKPLANFTYTVNKKVYNYNDTSTVANPAPECKITAWFWEFDDGEIDNSNAISPIHTYQSNGSHKARLTVTNSAGSSTTAWK